jgi:hypothetical protein
MAGRTASHGDTEQQAPTRVCGRVDSAGRADAYDFPGISSDGTRGMRNGVTDERGLERLLTTLLSNGTWLGSAVIAMGLILQCAGWGQIMSPVTCMCTVSVGIAIFIFLPVLRVVLMAFAFVRQREFVFGVIAVGVLAVIALTACVGMRVG